MLDISNEASNTMEVIKITLHLAFLMRQSWHQFHSNHKYWGSWLSHLENVDKCVNLSIIICPQGQSTNCLQLWGSEDRSLSDPEMCPIFASLTFARTSRSTWFWSLNSEVQSSNTPACTGIPINLVIFCLSLGDIIISSAAFSSQPMLSVYEALS